MRVLVSDKLDPLALEVLRERGLEVIEKTSLSHEELLVEIAGVEGLIVRSATKATREVIEAGVNLIAIGRAGIGVDNIDVDFATRRGIVVMNTPSGNTNAVVEHTMALILAMARHIAAALVDRLQGNRIGVVVFAGSAFVQCPLTLDDGAARIFLDAVTTGVVPEAGTNVARAIEAARRGFVSKESK